MKLREYLFVFHWIPTCSSVMSSLVTFVAFNWFKSYCISFPVGFASVFLWPANSNSSFWRVHYQCLHTVGHFPVFFAANRIHIFFICWNHRLLAVISWTVVINIKARHLQNCNGMTTWNLIQFKPENIFNNQ